MLEKLVHGRSQQINYSKKTLQWQKKLSKYPPKNSSAVGLLHNGMSYSKENELEICATTQTNSINTLT